MQKLVFSKAILGFADHEVVSITLTEEKAEMSCTIDKCQLVRTRSIVSNKLAILFVSFLFRDDSVAKSKSFDETLQVSIVLVTRVFDMRLELSI